MARLAACRHADLSGRESNGSASLSSSDQHPAERDGPGEPPAAGWLGRPAGAARGVQRAVMAAVKGLQWSGRQRLRQWQAARDQWVGRVLYQYFNFRKVSGGPGALGCLGRGRGEEMRSVHADGRSAKA